MKRQAVTVKSIILLLMISALLMTLGYSLSHAAEKTETISAKKLVDDRASSALEDRMAEHKTH